MIRHDPFFKIILPQHANTDAIISERDPKFISRFWQEYMYMCGVKLKISSVRHTKTDGAPEVMNREAENYLCYFCEQKQDNWDILLPSAEFVYNSAISEDLATLPFEVDLRWLPR